MASYIPFVSGEADSQLAAAIYEDCFAVRTCMDMYPTVSKSMHRGTRLWLDAGVDALHRGWPVELASGSVLRSLSESPDIASSDFQEKPNRKVVEGFSHALLAKCMVRRPDFFSIPQLPSAADGSRNKINKELARAAGDWFAGKKTRPRLILPVILVHGDQTHYKAQRTKLIKLTRECVSTTSAEGVWVVDSSLNDQSGLAPNLAKRFPALVAFHEELRESLNSEVFVVAGPYWGLNLVLWARGLVDHAGIGVGGGFQYFVPGGPRFPAKHRIVIGPIRRQAVVSADLASWLDAAMGRLRENVGAIEELKEIKRGLPTYAQSKPLCRKQVAKNYKVWLDNLEKSPVSSRKLVLFQELTEAYVVGKKIGKALPKTDQTTRRPERVAEQLMMSCL